jgi:hypothetical protein
MIQTTDRVQVIASQHGIERARLNAFSPAAQIVAQRVEHSGSSTQECFGAGLFESQLARHKTFLYLHFHFSFSQFNFFDFAAAK